MKVTYAGDHEKILLSVEKANQILINEDFYNRVSAHEAFDYTDEKPTDIASWFKLFDGVVIVKLYKSKNPFTRTLAYVSADYPDTVFINSRKLDRDAEEIVNTIIHESIHSLDNSLPNVSFGHGDNSSEGKGNSAPYWIGNLAERLLKGTMALDDDSISNDEIEFVEEEETIDPELIEN
jgi:hypothetical protein